MLLIECQNCRTSAFTEDPGIALGALACPPGSGCCEQDHDHDAAANACPGGHGACPTPDNCPLWLGMQPHLENSNARDLSAGSCPGGHCGPGVKNCSVCRPLKITVIPGSVSVQRSIGG